MSIHLQDGRARRIVTVALGGFAAFAAAAGAAETPFSEEAIARGVNYGVNAGIGHQGSGVGAFDIDNDGDPDLLLAGAGDGRIGLYENDGTGHFTDRTLDHGAPRLEPSVLTAGISAADYDGDGDLDIHVVRAGGPDRLYRNDGNWTFTDVSAQAGIENGGYGYSACWGDYDGDGDLDLYISNRTFFLTFDQENALYRNNGDGTFTDVSVETGTLAAGDPTLVSTFVDYDQDGDPDLYLGTDKGSGPTFQNRLLQNNNGVFTDVTDFSGTGANVDCMGIAVGDLDRNGWLDLYVTNIPQGNVLLMNNGDGTFADRTLEADVGVYGVGWGTACIDYNNDTFEDLYVCNMNGENTLFRNDGVFPFTDVSVEMGVNTPNTSFVTSIVDLDDDGDLDMVVSEYGNRVHIYMNEQGAQRNWVKVNVVGMGTNTFAVGAEVVAFTSASGTQIREIRAGHHYKSQDPTTLHFGMGAETSVKLRVTWPHNADSRTVENYPTNTTWTIYPPDRMGDVNLDGVIDRADSLAALEHYRDEGAAPVRPGTEQLDMDGDGTVDADDIAAIVGLTRTINATGAGPAGSAGTGGPQASEKP